MPEALFGTHALTGCDFTSCFFRKGKLKPFQRLVADISDWHVTALRSLTSIEVDMPGVTSFVCSMYGFTTSDINEARYKAFIRMSGGDEKYPLATIKKSNCASLPPCNKTLGNQACAQMHLHLQMQVQMRHLHLHLHLIPSRRMHLHLHLHLIHPHLHLHLHLIQMHLIESNANQMRIKCEPSEIAPECS